MAADVAVRPAWLSPGLDNLFRVTETHFTEKEKQRVFEDSNKILGITLQDLYKLLLLLCKQGQITKNAVFIKEYLAKQSSNKEEIESEVKEYLKELPEERPVLTGRDHEIEEITAKLRTVESSVINLYGVSGVGKTTVAKEICYRWNKESIGKSLIVDLREVKEMKFVYFNILQVLEPDKTTLIYEEEAVLKRVRRLAKEDQAVLVLLDNSEQFAGGKDKESKNLRTAFLGFLERLKSPEVDKFEKLRILLTARNQFTAARLVEDVHLKPLEEEQSGELLKSAGEPSIAEEEKANVLELCEGRPLLINTMAAAMKQEGVEIKELVCKIKEAKGRGKLVETVKPSGAEKPVDKEDKADSTKREELGVDMEDSSFLRPMFFNLPSKELQDSAVSLSLFCHPFALEVSAQLLDIGMDKAIFLLESLRSYNFITTGDPDAKVNTYDIHPLLKAFVNGIKSEPDFKQVFQKAETRFSHIFMDKASRMGKLLDKQYVDIHRVFNEERGNFELALDITTNRDYLFIPESQYHDIAMTAFLVDAMLDVEIRMKLFRSWAVTAEAEGKDCLAANLRCWQALQVLDMQGSHKAHEVLEKAKISIDKADAKDTDMFRLTEAKYHFALGKVYQDLYQEPKRALDEYLKSLEVTEQLLGDHTETARYLNAIGNCYQRLEEPQRAIEYFRRVYDMRERLSGEYHYDMPVYKSQIGAVFDRQGDYDQAIKHYQSAIDLQETLKISGYESTAIYYRNIANAYLHMDEFAEALEPAQKAYEIRSEILGVHPETTRSLFQLGLIWNCQEKGEEALRFYKEAWEMEKSLEKGRHSAVRDRIVGDLQSLYDDLRRKKEKKLFEEDALQFYRRIWHEEKSFEKFEFSSTNRKIMNMITGLYKSLGNNKAEMQIYQGQALHLYEKTWKERDILPELKWDKTRPAEKSVVKARGEILRNIVELAQALRDKGKVKAYEGERLSFCKDVFFAEGSVDIKEYTRPKLFDIIIKKLSKSREKQEFVDDALRLHERQFVELGSQKDEELGLSRVKAITAILEICSKFSTKEKLVRYQREALPFYVKLWVEKEGEMDVSCQKRVVQTIVKLASSLKEKTTEKEYKIIKQMLDKGEYVAEVEASAGEPAVPEASTTTEVEEDVEMGVEAQEEGGVQELEVVTQEEGVQELEVVTQPEEEVQELEVQEDVVAVSSDDDGDDIDEKTVSPQGSVCDFKRAAVRVTFPPHAVAEHTTIQCTALNPERCKPLTIDTEVLVSNVVELTPRDLIFAESVTLALSYSATKLRGYEVVVKELKDKANNTWEELDTVDTREETDVDSSTHQPEVAAPLPAVKSSIHRVGTFAAICRLASHSFDVTAEGVTVAHRKFSNLKVHIPAGAVSGKDRLKVHMKVQEIPAEDLKSPRAHACPAVHLHCSEEFTFRKPVFISVPVTRGDKLARPIPPCRIRVFFCRSGGGIEDWDDITDRLDKDPTLENDVVQFQVNHFSRFWAWLYWGKDEAFKLGEYAMSLCKQPPLPVLFRACERESKQRASSTTQLILSCLPAHMRDNKEPYAILSQADSEKDLRPQDVSYVRLDEDKGGLKAAQDMQDFRLVFKEHNPFEKPLDVRVVQCKKTRLYFFGDPERRTERLCDLSVELLPPGQLPPTAVEFFGVPISGVLSESPSEIVNSCYEFLNNESLKQAQECANQWDIRGTAAQEFYKELTNCDESTQDLCLNAILNELTVMRGAEGMIHIKTALEKGRAKVQNLVDQEIMILVSNDVKANQYWKRLARELQVPDSDINNIEEDNSKDRRECCHQSLLKWHHLKAQSATIRKLLRALTQTGLSPIVLKISGEIMKEE